MNYSVVEVQWNGSNILGTVNTINISPPVGPDLELESTFITTDTTIQLSVLYNQEYNISVVAGNCAGSSTPAESKFSISMLHMYKLIDGDFSITLKCPTDQCSYPTVDPSVRVESYSSRVEGSQVTYFCQPGLVPSERKVATCMSDGSWSPDPSHLECRNYTRNYTTINNCSIPSTELSQGKHECHSEFCSLVQS